MRWILLLVAGIAFAQAMEAGGMKGAEQLDDESRSAQRSEEFMRDAAAYRLGRATHVAEAGEGRLVETALAQAEEMRLHGGRSIRHLWFIGADTRARWIVEDAFDEHPYAPGAGQLLHYLLDRRIAGHEVRATLDALMRLWHYIPDHPDLGRAMNDALAMAEKLQDFEAAVDLESDDPAKVVRIRGEGMIFDLDDLLRFLSRHGDREAVAPRATLALARSLLLSGERETRWASRRAYEDFLERFPESPLAFEAVLEQGLSWLVTYKGSDYDVGALMAARDLVDVAELEVGGDPQRAARVAAYRRRIGAWMQDRDLSVATWYAARQRPIWLAWLRRPTWLQQPDVAARYYARQVIARDRTSRQAAQAEELLLVVPADDNTLGGATR